MSGSLGVNVENPNVGERCLLRFVNNPQESSTGMSMLLSNWVISPLYNDRL